MQTMCSPAYGSVVHGKKGHCSDIIGKVVWPLPIGEANQRVLSAKQSQGWLAFILQSLHTLLESTLSVDEISS